MSKSKFYDKIIDLADNVQRYVHVTEHNVATIYDYFCRNVIKNPKKISPNDIVAIFIGVITDGDNYYVHPKKPNYICTPFGDIQIDATQYKGFISYFNRTYTPQEKMKFAEISDRLIEDTNRRNKGEFYTPTLFVDYAHKMISEALGDNWKDEYVVWDNCCGTKNLTRDYRFKELYCSTLENAELDISSRYNPEATSFQYDFLNDPLEKLPKGLLEAFEQNKKIVFFLNPPYAKNSKLGAHDVGITNISKEMSREVGSLTTLHCQFLYRIMKIKQQFKLSNCYIGLFCKPILAQTTYMKFRVAFLNEFSFNRACLFNAGHFANVSSAWGISFTIFESGKDTNITYQHTLIDNKNGEIVNVGTKEIYNVDKLKSAKDWYIESFNKHTKDVEMISGNHPIYFKNAEQNKICQYYSESLGGFKCDGNNLAANALGNLLTIPANMNNVAIFKESFNRFAPYYSARKLIETNWIIDKDEYLAPNESHPKYQEYVNDSILYSIFSGNQSSLRKINLHNKIWDIKNEFFWMSKSEIESLANEFSNDTCYSDVHTSEDRFVYKKLQEINLTPEAQAVLDKACDIVRKTFKYRELFNEEHPEYQINNWDCGWYQIKALAKEYTKEDLEEFKKLYKTLADKMRPMVYELGFLK